MGAAQPKCVAECISSGECEAAFDSIDISEDLGCHCSSIAPAVDLAPKPLVNLRLLTGARDGNGSGFL